MVANDNLKITKVKKPKVLNTVKYNIIVYGVMEV